MNIERKFIRFIDEFPDTEMIERKKLHSLRVAKLAEEIGGTEKHFVAGLIHDAGRFPQALKYKTFDDSISVDHGELGFEIVKSWGIYDNEILAAIRYHNKLKLPDIEEKEFVYAIRDADMVDILRLVTEGKINPFGRFESPSGKISQEVKTLLNSKQLLPNALRYQSGLNSYLGKIAFIYELTFKKSFDILKREGILQKLFSVHSQDEETEHFLTLLYKDLEQHGDKLI